jgi:hypothetical protein
MDEGAVTLRAFFLSADMAMQGLTFHGLVLKDSFDFGDRKKAHSEPDLIWAGGKRELVAS